MLVAVQVSEHITWSSKDLWLLQLTNEDLLEAHISVRGGCSDGWKVDSPC